MGTIDNQNKAIQWFYYSNDEDFDGANPSITVQGDTVVLVFQNGGLKYSIGRLRSDSINWGIKEKYDNGVRPSVSMMGNIIIEMHESSYFNRLWYHIGIFNNDGSIIWGPSIKYERGLHPSVAMDQNSVLEVHQSDYFYTLFGALGIINYDTLKVHWNFDKTLFN